MRQGGGKAKGAEFERECCRLLSLWVSEGKQEDCFWRSAMSGGRSTVAHGKGKRLAAQSGDITCTDPKGAVFASRFYGECKFYRDLDLSSLFVGKGKLLEFWKTTCLEAARYDKLPFMFARQNRMPAFICLSHEGEESFFIRNEQIAHFYTHDLFIHDAKQFFANCSAPT